jgi:hypothetical protein
MPRTLFYLFFLCLELLGVVILQFHNYFEPAEIFMRTLLAFSASLIIGAASMGALNNLMHLIIDKLDYILGKLGFSVKDQRGKTMIGILIVTLISNGAIHSYISTKPSVSYRYLQSKNVDSSVLRELALINTTNYEKVADELKVFISYKNIKRIQKLAIDRMENQRDMLEVSRRLSKTYIQGLGQSNGFDMLVQKLYDQGRQDVIYTIYKDVLHINQNSLNFAGAPALTVLVRAIENKEFLREIMLNPNTPDFCAKIVKRKRSEQATSARK